MGYNTELHGSFEVSNLSQLAAQRLLEIDGLSAEDIANRFPESSPIVRHRLLDVSTKEETETVELLSGYNPWSFEEDGSNPADPTSVLTFGDLAPNNYGNFPMASESQEWLAWIMAEILTIDANAEHLPRITGWVQWIGDDPQDNGVMIITNKLGKFSESGDLTTGEIEARMLWFEDIMSIVSNSLTW